MNTEQKAKWAETRANGKGRFILFQGIFKIGVLFAVLTTLGNYLSKYGFTSSQVAEYLLNGETIFNFFFGVIFFGLGMGLFFWYFNEREFRKPEKNKI